MNNKIKSVFLILVLFQGLHSIEEYIGKLWKVFPPATALTSLVSSNLKTGFLIINIGLFIFGLLCWLLLVRKNHPLTKIAIWFWIILEIINGIGHSYWAFMQKAYTPGLYTAPFLLITAVYLFKNLHKSKAFIKNLEDDSK